MRSLLAVLIAALSSLLSASEFNPSAIWMNGFILLQSGQRAEGAGDGNVALREYGSSLRTYRELEDYFPSFQAERRRQRVALLVNKIESMGGNPQHGSSRIPLTGAEEEAKSDAALPEPPALWKRETKNGEMVYSVPLVRTPETRAYHGKMQKLLEASPIRIYNVPR